MNRPKHPRRDNNQTRLIRAVEQCGVYVWDLADVGGEVLDTLMCYRGRCLPVEIKRPGYEDDLTDGERQGIEALRWVGVEPVVATCAEDVLEAFGAMVRQ